MYRILVIVILVLSSISGCGTEKAEEEMTKYEGTVISKKNTSIVLLQEKIELTQQMELGEAFEKFDRDLILQFTMDIKEIEKVTVGDFVVVFSNGLFEDMEPPRGFAEKVNVKD